MKLKIIGILLVVFAASVGLSYWWYSNQLNKERAQLPTPAQLAQEYDQVLPPLSSSPSGEVNSSTPSTKTTPTLSFAELNRQVGPCVILPTLMYHHVQDLTKAKQLGHAQLTVGTSYFEKQMQYLKDQNYTVVGMTDLINFFDNGTSLPRKPVLLTFDDGYDDFATDAAPVLESFGYKATLFTPTGLLENPGYLHWSTLPDLAAHHILIANHTWSHHSMGASKPVIEKEITLADQQLTQRGYDSPKVFAYPYGLSSPYAVKFLATQGYEIAFTTQHGSTLCRGQRLLLPRIRVGNAQLSLYGL